MLYNMVCDVKEQKQLEKQIDEENTS